MTDNAKPHILFLLTTADWGGAQWFVFQAAQEAVRRGYRVVIASGEQGELKQRCGKAGLTYRHLNHIRRAISPWHDLASIYEIRRLIQDVKPTVVHLNSSKMGVVGSIAANLERVPRVIYRIGGWSFLEELGWFHHHLYLWAERWTAHRKDVIVTVHPGDEDVARREHILPRDRLMTIANGIDLQVFDQHLKTRMAARNLLELKPDERIVGTIANFYPAKNLIWYLNVIAEMRPQLTNTRFIIIGDGPQKKILEEECQRLHLEHLVIFAGRRSDASSLLSAFDLFVLPSSKEGMPWSLLEAMAASLPCIATDVGACRWMLEGDAGQIVKAGDEKNLQETILRVLNDQEGRRTLGQKARHAVEQRFTWKQTIEKTLTLFER